MGSFFSKLFGGSNKNEGPKRSEPVDYKGFQICAAPEKSGDGWNLAGVIIKLGTSDGESGENAENAENGENDGNMERHYIRADMFNSLEQAVTFSLQKGEQIIDEQGDRLFADGEKQGRT